MIKANLFSFQFFQPEETPKRPYLLRAGLISPPKQKTDTALGDRADTATVGARGCRAKATLPSNVHEGQMHSGRAVGQTLDKALRQPFPHIPSPNNATGNSPFPPHTEEVRCREETTQPVPRRSLQQTCPNDSAQQALPSLSLQGARRDMWV